MLSGVDCLYLYLSYKVSQDLNLEMWSIQFHALFLYVYAVSEI